MRNSFIVRSKLGDYLKERGISKSWLARKIGADRSQVTKWCTNNEKGCIVTPSLIYLMCIIKVLNCKLDDIFDLVDVNEYKM